MNLSQIHHVAIITAKYEASKLYVDKLGFQVIRENYRAHDDYKRDLQQRLKLEIFGIKNAPKRPSYPEAWVTSFSFQSRKY